MFVRRWEHAGMACAIRHGAFGVPCGYVRVPEGHRLHGLDCEGCDEFVRVHGGVTWSGALDEEDGWWIGFDMAHSDDLVFAPGFPFATPLLSDGDCALETEYLAEQLAGLGGGGVMGE